MSLDLAPVGAAASPRRRVARQTAYELRSTLRNGEQLLLTLVIPLALLFALGLTRIVNLGAGDRLALVIPGILSLAVMSAAFTSLAVATGFERRYGALTLLGTTPLTRTELLIAKAGSVLGVEAIQFALIVGAGLLLGWSATGIGWAIVWILLGTIAFAAWGVLLSGCVRAEATLAIANGVYLILLLAGGTVIPVDRMPAGLASVVQWLPSAALGNGLRATMADGTFLWLPAAVLVAWAVVGTTLAARFFRWQ